MTLLFLFIALKYITRVCVNYVAYSNAINMLILSRLFVHSDEILGILVSFSEAFLS